MIRPSMLCLSCLALLLTASPAGAMRLAVPLPELCARASVIVVAEVTTTEGRWRVGEPAGIETTVDIAITRVVRGQPPTAVSFVVPGGSIGSLSQWISEAPRFLPDARYLLLLASDAGHWALVGGADGALLIPWGEGEEAAALAALGACGA